MKKLFTATALLLLMVSSAFALSDSEFLRMKKNNADFARADRRLTKVWRKLKVSTPKRAFAELKELQRDWIAYGRDDEAESLMRDGYSRAEAYTMVTSDRADYLPELAQEIIRRMRRRR